MLCKPWKFKLVSGQTRVTTANNLKVLGTVVTLALQKAMNRADPRGSVDLPDGDVTLDTDALPHIGGVASALAAPIVNWAHAVWHQVQQPVNEADFDQL